MIQTPLFVAGASYTFVPTTLSIVLAGRYSDLVDPVEKFENIMRGTQGALIVASILQIVLGFSGLWRNVMRFMSPLFVGFLFSGGSRIFIFSKIVEDMRPPEPLAKALTMLSRVMPKAKLVPQKDLAELAIRDLKKRKQT